jgi:uncharacterized protein (DUF4415 family)
MSRPSTLPAALHWPDDAEEAAIQRGIAADPDNPELTEADIRAMTPALALLPDFKDGVMRRRGRQKTPTREPVILRLDREVTAALRRSGPGWQTRAAALLKTMVLGGPASVEAPTLHAMVLHEAQALAPAAPAARAKRRGG